MGSIEKYINMEKHETIKLIIPGEPKAQQRHRSRISLRKGKKAVEAHNKKTDEFEKLYRREDLFIHMYDPSYKDKKFMAQMIACLAPRWPMQGPVRVDRYYYFPYLKGHYGAGRNAGKIKASAPFWKSTGVDIDNCDKILFDVLTGLFIVNDSQICLGIQARRYDRVPRTEVFITPLNEIEGGHIDELQVQANRLVAAPKYHQTQMLAFKE